MTHRVNKQANTFAYVLSILGLLMVFLPAIFIIGPHIEGAKLPVLKDVAFELVKVENNQMIFHFTGEKTRACKLVELKVLVDEDGSGPNLPHVGKIAPYKYATMSELPMGIQDFGFWSIEPVGGKITIQAKYDCHPFWDTVAKVGEWSSHEAAQQKTQ